MAKKKIKPIVAVVGRPNVGKSTLFNALAGDKIAIVKDTPGITRDRIYADINWLDYAFTLIDTGGIEPDSSDIILSQMRDQAQIAIDTADVILFIGQIAFCRVYPDCNTAEIEYCIGKKFWGKGYAGEALQAVIDFTFSNTDFTKLEAYHRIENTKSGRVLEKSAMEITDNVERFRRENQLPHGEVCYCIRRKI